MLIMVIAKPIQLVMVRAVPLSVGVALRATIVENNGESAMTINPQKSRRTINRTLLVVKNNGEAKQHKQDAKRVKNAIRFVPNRVDITPPITHPTLPMATIKKDHNEILKEVSGCSAL